MAISNNSVSDVTLEMKSSLLSDACSKWEKEVSTSDLASINIEGTFSCLTKHQIGVEYIASLKTALTKVSTQARGISGLLQQGITAQQAADQKGYDTSSSNSYNSYRRNNSGGTGGSGGNHNFQSSSVDNTDLKLDINKDGKVDENDVSEETALKVMQVFHSIYKGDLLNTLYNAKDASIIKKTLLESPNLSEDVKALIGKLDDKTIINLLKKQYLSGKMMTDFSKATIIAFDNDLKEMGEKVDIFDASENISKSFNEIANSKDPQAELAKLFKGDASSNTVDDNTIHFSRRVVDIVATAANTTYEDVLTSSTFKDAINAEMKNVADAFAVVYGAKTSGESAEKTLFTNITKDLNTGVKA